MGEFRYSEWDGSQELFDIDADELMDKVGDDLMSNQNLSDILKRMMRNGMQNRQGKRLPGLQDMMQKLRQKRQDQLDKYDLGSIVDEIPEKLNEIKKKKRQGIPGQLHKARQKAKPGSKDEKGQTGQQEGTEGSQEGEQEGGQEGGGDMTPEMRERLN